MTFHTARSTAFPQPAPGTAPSPGPKLVPADQLRSVLGVSSVKVARGKQPLAIVDSLASRIRRTPRMMKKIRLFASGLLRRLRPFGEPHRAGGHDNHHRQFRLHAREGDSESGDEGESSSITTIFRIMSSTRTIKFRSKALDTDESFVFTFDKPGEFVYFCGLHPQMKGKIT